MKYQWRIVHDCDDENGNPCVWAKEINSKEYGKFVWIGDTGDGFEITTSEYPEDPIMVCKTLKSAKRWVSMNIQ